MTLIAGYDRDAPRRAVNLSLNEDLVAKARNLTGNLSGTVESLLAGFVEREQAQRRAEDKALDDVVMALNDFHDRHGFLSDEFPSL
jgi:antitoxin CcdA